MHADALAREGAKKVAVLGYSQASSARFINQLGKAIANSKTMQVVYQSTDVAAGTTDFSSYVDKIKQSGADSIYLGMDTTASVATINALKQAGVNYTNMNWIGGYDPRVLAVPAVNGVTFAVEWKPFEVMQQDGSKGYVNYAKYLEQVKPGSLHNQLNAAGWLAADAMITGLKETKDCLQRKAFIKNLMNTKNYTADGCSPRSRLRRRRASPTAATTTRRVTPRPRPSCRSSTASGSVPRPCTTGPRRSSSTRTATRRQRRSSPARRQTAGRYQKHSAVRYGVAALQQRPRRRGLRSSNVPGRIVGPYIFGGLVVGSIYAISALGLVLTYSSSRVFNFAHGAIAYGVAVFYYWLTRREGWSVATAAPFTILIVAPLIGLLLYGTLFRRLTHRSPTVRLVATVGLWVAIPALVRIIFPFVRIDVVDPQGLVDNPVDNNFVKVFGTWLNTNQFAVIVSAIVIAVGTSLPAPLHAVGLATRMSVDQPVNASIAGVNTEAVTAAAWMAGTMLAGFAGVLLAPIVGLLEYQFTLLLVGSFAVVVIARMTSLPLAFIGAIGIGLAQQIWIKYQPDSGFFSQGVSASIPFLVMLVFLIGYSFSSKGLKREAFAVDRRAGMTVQGDAPPLPPAHGWRRADRAARRRGGPGCVARPLRRQRHLRRRLRQLLDLGVHHGHCSGDHLPLVHVGDG